APVLSSAPATVIPAMSCSFNDPDTIPNDGDETWTCPIRVNATWTDVGTEGNTFTVKVDYEDKNNTVLTTTTTAATQSSPATVDNTSVTILAVNLPYNVCTTVSDDDLGVSNQVCSPFTFNIPPSGTTITAVSPEPSNEAG